MRTEASQERESYSSQSHQNMYIVTSGTALQQMAILEQADNNCNHLTNSSLNKSRQKSKCNSTKNNASKNQEIKNRFQKIT